MNEQPPERGRRRLREPDAASPPPSRPAPRRADAHPSGYQELPQPSRHSGAHDLPQPSRRARPEPGYDPRRDAPPSGRRRLEPPGTLPPADDEFDPQAQQAAPARAARARHGLDEGSEIEPAAPRRRRAAPDPAEPPQRRAAPERIEPSPPRRRRADAAEPVEAVEPPRGRRRGAPDPAGTPDPRRRPDPAEAEPQPGRRGPEPMAAGEPVDPPSRRRRADPAAEPQPGRRGPAPEPMDTVEPPSRRRRADPAEPPPGRRGLTPEPMDIGDPVEPPSRRRRADPAESQPGRRGLTSEPMDIGEPVEPPSRRRRADPAAELPGRRGPAPDPVDAADPRRRRALEPDADPRRGAPDSARRPAQPGDRPAGVPEPGAEPRRRRPPVPPVREEPVTDVLPALAPPPPAEPPRAPQDEPEHSAQDDEYADYDEYEDYDEPEYDADYEDYDDYDEEPAKPRKKKGKRALGWIAAVAVIALLAGGAWYGFNRIFGYDDFDGAGTEDVLFQVDDGDTTSAIGAKLTSAGIVASGKAFVKAGEGNPKLARIQHGFYVMKSHMSGASAVDRLTAPASRVGQLEIRPYTQFDDITQPDGKVTPGVYSLMAKASCAQLNGKSTCISADDLRKAVDTADLKQLGVPDWAVEPANKADRKDRRLEGLIAPGVYDVKPGSAAPEILGQLVRASAAAIQEAGLGPQTAGPGMTPYQTLIIASIIEREGVKADFGKLSRVIYNRLASNMRLQMDSTVNYVLDRPTLLTDEAERLKSGAYNTYKNTGLPPTPIAVSSPDAIKAAVKPPAGAWVYFVKCEKNGLSCFAVTNDEHNRNRDLAKERGVI
ncbi:endolytic transglycosylase MltG [Amycolatopsis sp. A133]|uniref:endolytic transglycosylase MltG n=1 Tax=Amycolatopsis sp. A133 TaxID=3064472 RepID=UPI0027EC0B86|nr:endolytic transglycosylase MltG [Amycolatopsis sp. A133]MDQ7803330.1 endolytic transglycosylase MltG [Amycolatopsis sp. A133]